MSNPKQNAQGRPGAPGKSLPFSQMSAAQKAIFICKLAISIISFGFIFPSLTSGD